MKFKIIEKEEEKMEELLEILNEIDDSIDYEVNYNGKQVVKESQAGLQLDNRI